MVRVYLLHWNEAEAGERAERLRALGYAVDTASAGSPTLVREIGADPPAACGIDLSRLPSHGREIAMLLRTRATTRRVPLVFVDGKPDKVARIRELLPDAVYTTWDGLGPALQEAIASPPADPVTPKSSFDAYAGTPLIVKLGIKPDSVVRLVDAPAGFEDVLGELPSGAAVRRGSEQAGDLSIWFVRSRAGLESDMPAMVELAAESPLWIAWPKKASGRATDLTQQIVREAGLAAGLVDYKVCSIDRTWSGLLFRRRRV